MAREQQAPVKARYEVVVGFCLGEGVNALPGDVVELTEFEARRYSDPDNPWITPTKKDVGPAKPDPNHRKVVVRNQDPKGLRNQDPK